jgi:hypothetical protein
MTSHNMWAIAKPLLVLGGFFLPTFMAIFTQHPLYITVGIFNCLLFWALFASHWFVLGWFLLLYLVWTRRGIPGLIRDVTTLMRRILRSSAP